MTVEEAWQRVHDRTRAMMEGKLGDELPPEYSGPVIANGDPNRDARLMLVGLEVDDTDDMMNRLAGAAFRLVGILGLCPDQEMEILSAHQVLVQIVLFGYLLGEAAGREAGS